MLDQMRGHTETYEEEIKEIMSWTDEDIMLWMQQHNIDFKNATEAQQESFLYGWKITLEEWRKAFEDVTDEIVDLTSKTQTNGIIKSASGSNSAGGGTAKPATTQSSTTAATAQQKQFEPDGTGSATTSKATMLQMEHDGNTYVRASDGVYWYKLSDATTTEDGKHYVW